MFFARLADFLVIAGLELLLEYLGVLVVMPLVVLLLQRYHPRVLLETEGVHLDDTHDSRRVEVVHEVIHLPGIAQVVATGKELAYFQFGLKGGVGPQVLAQTSFGGELTVVGEVVIELVRIDLRVDVRYVELYVKSFGLVALNLDVPSYLAYCPSNIWLNTIDFANDSSMVVDLTFFINSFLFQRKLSILLVR